MQQYNWVDLVFISYIENFALVLLTVQHSGEALETLELRGNINLNNKSETLNKITLNRGCCRPSKVGVNVDIFGLWRLLLVMWRKVGWWGIHQSWWRLHLRSQRRGAMSHVRRDEGLKGLLGMWAPVILEGRMSAWA